MIRAKAACLALFLLGACLAGGRPKGELEPSTEVTSTQVSEALRPQRLAVVVGINTFRDDRWPALRHAVSDATAFGELLQDPAQGRFDWVEVLADPAGTLMPQIQDLLDRVEQRNRSEEDTVVVYLSTHGTLARDPEGNLSRYLVTSDSDQDQIRASALPVRELLARFDRLPSRRKALILAACHSGSGKSALPAPIGEELRGTKGAFFVRPLEEISQASMVLAASAWGETAREDDSLGHDIYTNFLLEALKKGDINGDGAVTASEAHAWAMERTYYFSGGRQRPQLESTVLGADPIVLTGRKTAPGAPVLFSFLSELQGMRIAVDGRDKGILPGRVAVSPGSHRVVVSDGADRPTVLDEELSLAPGEEVAVETLLRRNERHWYAEARAGYQQFLDPAIREKLVGPIPVFDLSFVRRDFPLKQLETGLDFSLGGGSQIVHDSGLPIRQNLFEIGYGVSVLYRFELGPVVFLVGPRLGGLHVFRYGIDPPPLEGDQEVSNTSVGLLGGIRWNLWSALSLGAEARLHLYSLRMSGRTVNLGYLDLLAGLGLSF